ncbi:hypothetical protein QSV34_00590 [Porticoccus sp. W117]|uniref:hypothetical protein n=1 Tax=Porticoccus sp. W117 TaxID=3054777 RepID=UPI0025948925|nr:hypothetical protein [Porticoccus sp. W117]MDM3869840.1 hypothetical protein [Porticoccus sp. W117]
MKISTYYRALLAICSFVLLSGCATKIEQPALAIPERSTVPLGSYDNVYLADISMAEEYAGQSANEKAAKRIGEVLFRNMRQVFPKLEKISHEGAEKMEANKDHALIIKPHIRQIKFIGGGARFFVGAMAGSSVVVMEAQFVDVATGESVAWPEYQRIGRANSGAWSIGATDNRMLEDIAKDFSRYASYNK